MNPATTSSHISNNPVSGLRYLLRGLSMLGHPRLRRFVIVPLVVNILVFSIIGWLGFQLFSGLIDQWLPQEGWLSWLGWLLWPLFAIAGLLVTFFTFTSVANLIAAPFNGLLAEKVETLITGQAPSCPGGGILKDLIPAMLSELHKQGYFLLRAIPLLMLFFIPGIHVLAPPLWLLFSAWFIALEYADFPMGNSGYRFAQQRPLMKPIRFTHLGFGGGVTLLMAIPLIHFVAMPAAVIGASLMWCEQREALSRIHTSTTGNP